MKAVTRAKLVQVAAEAFQRQPYSSVTMRGLAVLAGTSTGAWFNHWPDGKQALYREVTGRQPPDAVAAFVPEIEAFLADAMVQLVGTAFDSIGQRAFDLRKKLVGSAG